MLKKLFKYEYKSTARWMLPMYGFVLLVAFINMFFINSNGMYISVGSRTIGSAVASALPALFMFVYVISLVGMALATFFIAAQRFYSNLFANEGYISLTLPVKTHDHIIAKLVTALTWVIGSVIVGIISFFILMARTGIVSELLKGLPVMMGDLNSLLSGNGTIFIIEIIVYGIVCAISALLMIYAALAIGQLSNNHKVGMAILAYLGISFVINIIEFSSIVGMVSNIAFLSNISAVSAMMSSFGFGILWQAILSAAYFFVTRLIITKRVNLQ